MYEYSSGPLSISAPRAAQPVGALVDRAARRRLEREVVEADAVAVERLLRRRLRLPQAERAARAREVPDRLAALALDLADAVPAERLEQLPVEGQAAEDRADDEVDVVKAGGAHCLPRFMIYLGPDSSSPRP